MGRIYQHADVVQLLQQALAEIAEAGVGSLGAAGADEILVVVGQHDRPTAQLEGLVVQGQISRQAIQRRLRIAVRRVFAFSVCGTKVLSTTRYAHPRDLIGPVIEPLHGLHIVAGDVRQWKARPGMPGGRASGGSTAVLREAARAI